MGGITAIILWPAIICAALAFIFEMVAAIFAFKGACDVVAATKTVAGVPVA